MLPSFKSLSPTSPQGDDVVYRSLQTNVSVGVQTTPLQVHKGPATTNTIPALPVPLHLYLLSPLHVFLPLAHFKDQKTLEQLLHAKLAPLTETLVASQDQAACVHGVCFVKPSMVSIFPFFCTFGCGLV